MREITALKNASAVIVGDIDETRTSIVRFKNRVWSVVKFDSVDATNSLLRTTTACLVRDATLVAMLRHLDSKLAVQMNKSTLEGRTVPIASRGNLDDTLKLQRKLGTLDNRAKAIFLK
jgi:hypothetical protein